MQFLLHRGSRFVSLPGEVLNYGRRSGDLPPFRADAETPNNARLNPVGLESTA